MARHQLKLPFAVKRLDERQAQHRKLTHEQFVHEVAKLGVELLNEEERAKAQRSKLTYGHGQAGLRGVTYFNRWLNDQNEQAHFVEICANGEQNPVQLAGTTLHELGHVVAGWEAGHKKEWHCACGRLGLHAIRAAGTHYVPAMFDKRIRAQVMALIERLNDGKPNGCGLNARPSQPKPCSAGIGTRGGTSRGVGSGSRLRKWVCACEPKPVIARVSSDDFQATCNRCNSEFRLARDE